MRWGGLSLRLWVRRERCQARRVGVGVSVHGGSVAPVTSRGVFITVRAPVELRAAAVQCAKESGTTVSDICRNALVMFVATHSGPVMAPAAAPAVEGSSM